ncbi:hypothetical protein SSX86_004845 [Deinandra increscens subsp. villosa]|uniref:Fe2OG dioxygenase domain-containing protein n=1 Tax=Deinandra increscens subsp. villosa TaxID=3103831 RepID=A0AAP0DJZ1_9ASTR
MAGSPNRGVLCYFITFTSMASKKIFGNPKKLRREKERMEAKGDTSFTSVMAITETCQQNIPQQYVLPRSQRPNTTLVDQISTSLPVIDLSMLDHPAHRSQLILQVHTACNQLGFFQVINHGISTMVMKGALDSAEEFFDLPSDEKMCFASADVHKPVRYGTSMNHELDQVFYWRDFIKHYANPISEWIDLWPSSPPTYKEKMGNYGMLMNLLQKKLIEVVLESLGLNANYLQDDIKEGSQVMAVNCYPSCPEPDLALGMPPHTDYGTLTILNQSHQGLEIMDHEKKWHPVPFIEGALIVQLGDQFEVISNGRYKSIPHRAVVNVQKKRFSIASLHSMRLEKKVGPAPELVDEQNPVAYKEGSFGEFLDYISVKSPTEGKYMDILKIHERRNVGEV